MTTLTVVLRAGPQGQTKRRQAKAERLMRVSVRFVLPVAIWSMLVGVAVYTYVYFRTSQVLTSETVPAEVITTFEQATDLTYQAGQTVGLTAARIQAQTALSVFLSFSALLLILFWSRQSRGAPSGVRSVRIPSYLAGAGSDGLVCDRLIYACGFQLFRLYSAARAVRLAGYWARAHVVGRGLMVILAPPLAGSAPHPVVGQQPREAEHAYGAFAHEITIKKHSTGSYLSTRDQYHCCPAGLAKKSVIGSEQSHCTLPNKGNCHDTSMVRKSE